MNLRNVTIQDCMEMHEMKGQGVIIHDGCICGFVHENNETEETTEIEYPCQTAKSEQG